MNDALASSNHEAVKKRSYRNLEEARREANRKRDYDSSKTRDELTQKLVERFGHPPKAWQLDVTEAILLGLDTLVIAGTGAGKTMPFIMPLLLDDKMVQLIISPLKILQADQANRFRDLKFKAAQVNGDTFNENLKMRLKNVEYQVILTSPEMMLQTQPLRDMATSKEFAKRLGAVIIDEAHTVPQWGPEFRPEYADIGRLRAMFAPSTPFFATSATLTPPSIETLCKSVDIQLESSFFLNLGNDRPNITQRVIEINSTDDFEALRPLLNVDADRPEDIEKTIVFVDSKIGSQVACREIRKLFKPHLADCIEFLHAERTANGKKDVTERFRRGISRLLAATESARMGLDIADIMKVLQLGCPPSLDVWIQRAGRAGRRSDIQAVVYLMYEKFAFTKKSKPRGKRLKAGDDEEKSESEDEDGIVAETTRSELESGTSSQLPATADVEPLESSKGIEDGVEKAWTKTIHNSLRLYIKTAQCRRDVCDAYFDNPPGRSDPTGVCCDNCERRDLAAARPSTPPAPKSTTTSPASSPTKSGKRILTQRARSQSPTVPKPPVPQTRAPGTLGVKNRRSDYHKSVTEALELWIIKAKRNHPRLRYSNISASSILPTSMCRAIASDATICTVDELKARIGWTYADEFGAPLLDYLCMLDTHELERKAARKQSKKQSKQQSKQQPTPPPSHMTPRPSRPPGSVLRTTAPSSIAQPPQHPELFQQSSAYPGHSYIPHHIAQPMYAGTQAYGSYLASPVTPSYDPRGPFYSHPFYHAPPSYIAPGNYYTQTTPPPQTWTAHSLPSHSHTTFPSPPSTPTPTRSSQHPPNT